MRVVLQAKAHTVQLYGLGPGGQGGHPDPAMLVCLWDTGIFVFIDQSLTPLREC